MLIQKRVGLSGLATGSPIFADAIRRILARIIWRLATPTVISAAELALTPPGELDLKSADRAVDELLVNG
jgi:hypothetical protein